MSFFKLRWKGRPHGRAPRIREENTSSTERPSLKTASRRAAKNVLRRSFSSDLKRARQQEAETAANRRSKNGRGAAERRGQVEGHVMENEIEGNGQEPKLAIRRSGRKKGRSSLWKAPSLEFAGVSLSKEKRPTIWRWPSFDLNNHGSTTPSVRGDEEFRAEIPSEPSTSLFYPPAERHKSWLASVLQTGSAKSVSDAVTPASEPFVAVGKASFDATPTQGSHQPGQSRDDRQETTQALGPAGYGRPVSLYRFSRPPIPPRSAGTKEGSTLHPQVRVRRHSAPNIRLFTDQRPPQQRRRKSLGTIALTPRRVLRVGSLADMSTIVEGSGSHMVSSEALDTEIKESEKVKKSNLVLTENRMALKLKDSTEKNPLFDVNFQQRSQERREGSEDPHIRATLASFHSRSKSESVFTARSVYASAAEELSVSDEKSESSLLQTNRIQNRVKTLSYEIGEKVRPNESLDAKAQRQARQRARKAVWLRAMAAREQREREQMLQRRAALVA